MSNACQLGLKSLDSAIVLIIKQMNCTHFFPKSYHIISHLLLNDETNITTELVIPNDNDVAPDILEPPFLRSCTTYLGSTSLVDGVFLIGFLVATGGARVEGGGVPVVA